MTGLQTADNRMFENTDAPWMQALSPRIPTVGHMLRKAGYYTAQGQVAPRDFELRSDLCLLFTTEIRRTDSRSP